MICPNCGKEYTEDEAFLIQRQMEYSLVFVFTFYVCAICGILFRDTGYIPDKKG